jgi:hypothetical protein
MTSFSKLVDGSLLIKLKMDNVLLACRSVFLDG